jgi:hypothetical protein
MNLIKIGDATMLPHHFTSEQYLALINPTQFYNSKVCQLPSTIQISLHPNFLPTKSVRPGFV